MRGARSRIAAARFFKHQPDTIAAVTGTSGKTSVAAFTRQIWEATGEAAASIGTIGLVAPGREIYGSLTTPDPVALHRSLDELAGVLATVVVEGGLPKRLQRRRHRRMIDTVKEHFIICGYGRIGRIVAREFQRQQVPLVVIERDPQRLQAAMDDGALAVEADASREDVLKRVGIERARGLIAAVGTDAENVYAVLTARVLRPDLFIVGRAETEDATIKLKRAGADRVISPPRSAPRRWRRRRCAPPSSISSRWQPAPTTSSSRWRKWRSPPAPRWPSRRWSMPNLRQRFGVIVVGIQRDRPATWNSTRRPTARFTPATSSSSSAGRIRSNNSKWRPRRYECSRPRRHRRRESDSE